MSPTARSLELLRAMGYVVQVVEQWNNYARIRVDLYGCIDVLAAHPEHGILGVQATTTSNAAARAAKAIAAPSLAVWLAAGGGFQIWGWALRGARGRRKLWSLTRRRAHLTSDGRIWFEEMAADAERPSTLPQEARSRDGEGNWIPEDSACIGQGGR